MFTRQYNIAEQTNFFLRTGYHLFHSYLWNFTTKIIYIYCFPCFEERYFLPTYCQGGQRLENLEKPGICNMGLKNLGKLFILKKKLEKHEFALKKPWNFRMCLFSHFLICYDLVILALQCELFSLHSQKYARWSEVCPR